jgi:hypothetical protein
MKPLTFLTAAALALLPFQALSFERVKTEADYVKLVVGNTYCNDGGCWIAKKNGKMTGKFGKEKFRANWKWHKGFGCRSGKLGKKDIGTDCQMIEVSGDQLRITRKQGKGKKVVYTKK